MQELSSRKTFRKRDRSRSRSRRRGLPLRLRLRARRQHLLNCVEIFHRGRQSPLPFARDDGEHPRLHNVQDAMQVLAKVPDADQTFAFLTGRPTGHLGGYEFFESRVDPGVIDAVQLEVAAGHRWDGISFAGEQKGKGSPREEARNVEPRFKVEGG